jgi:hemolysin activation/secretion protein
MGLSGSRLDGARLEIEADYADGEPDLARAGGAADQTLTTNESNFRIGLSVPFIRTRAQNLFGGLWLDWQDSENVTVFGNDDFTEQDRLLVLAAELSWDRATPSGVTLVKAGLRQGIDTSNTFIGGGPSNGVADFTLGTLELARLQRLGTGPWSLWLEGVGQYGADILPNPERFALGDGTIGRGFAPGNTTGDSGYGGRIELRRQVAAETLGRFGEAAELYAYGDYGQAYDRDGERDGERWEPLGSAGIGVRLDVRPWLSITPEIAQQLDGVPTDTRNPDLETRFFISAVARF